MLFFYTFILVEWSAYYARKNSTHELLERKWCMVILWHRKTGFTGCCCNLTSKQLCNLIGDLKFSCRFFSVNFRAKPWWIECYLQPETDNRCFIKDRTTKSTIKCILENQKCSIYCQKWTHQKVYQMWRTLYWSCVEKEVWPLQTLLQQRNNTIKTILSL